MRIAIYAAVTAVRCAALTQPPYVAYTLTHTHTTMHTDATAAHVCDGNDANKIPFAKAVRAIVANAKAHISIHKMYVDIINAAFV